MIKLVSDTIDNSDIDSLIEWLKTYPRLTKGEETIKFEEKWSSYISNDDSEKYYSVYVNSGSSANLLMIYALLQSGRMKNNKVVVPALSWATTLSPVLQFNMEPILCDVCMDTLSVNIEHLESIFSNEAPSTMIMVNALGFMGKINEIRSLCDKYDVILLEDSCETIGSTYNGKNAGTFGLMSTFSLYFGHHISTIEGGMICTKDAELYDMLLMLRSHGWDRDIIDDNTKSKLRDQYSVNDFNAMYTFYVPGFNLRSTDLQAKIGISQIDKLANISQIRQLNLSFYDYHIENSYWKIDVSMLDYNDIISNFAYPIIHPLSKSIISDLIENDIEVRPLIGGSMGRQPMFTNLYGEQHLINADIIHEYGFYLPNHVGITEEDIIKIAHIVNKYTGEN